MKKFAFYINTDFDNLSTLGMPLEDSINQFGQISWHEFLELVLGLVLSDQKTIDYAESTYGISPDEFSNLIDDQTIDKHYADISYYYDFVAGPAASAYNLISDLKIIPIDNYGCGLSNGVELFKTTADGPSKQLFIENEQSASWLHKQLLAKGVVSSFKFI